MQDLLSDYVARVNNGVLAKKNLIQVLKNNIVINVSKKLTRLGYIKSFQEQDRVLLLDLDVDKISKISRVSKPGSRKYLSYKSSPKILGGVGFNILSTSKGIMTHIEASKANIGGEFLFQIF